ncbi:MAG: peptidase M16, partial [Nitrospinae bacterium CG11_big_fil_rev_8_21_14_0_20_56_8]
MNFELNQTYSGFRLIQREDVAELKSLALLFEHERTGAQVLSLENDDDNKVFSVTFRTPPSDDTGVAHILEHSVLCGSRKFPVKEPFLELLKGSLQTFLNAMTFPDKTMYPVASRNLKDFYNLMDVYLDAVFYPKLTREIFQQEGWHHELETLEDELIFKGVVYNEMKGEFSNPESLLDRYMAHALFPSNAYGHESGGHPETIPNLTYEQFRDFHRKYYHPSNSRIFFYGDANTADLLKYLEESYLGSFEKKDAQSALRPQRRFSKPKRKLIYYPVSKKESLEKKTYVMVGLKLDKATNQEHCLAFSILNHLLIGTSAAPLRKALMGSGLGSEIIGGGFDDDRAETMFAVGLKGTEPDNEQKILDLIFSTLSGLVQNGIDGDLLTAAVNTVEFRLREANFGGFAKGIVYNIRALSSWLYDADPLMHLKYEDLMAKIKRRAHKGYFEKLIDRWLLNNSHQCVVIGVPKPGLANRQEARTRKKLRAVKASLTLEEKKHLVEATDRLKKMQESHDSREALATLPVLGLEDIRHEAEKFPLEIKKESSPQILFHELYTNRIAYIQIGFNTRSVPQDRIPYLSLIGKMILGMGTNKRDYVEMSNRLGIHTGGIRTWQFSCVPVGRRDEIVSYLFFKGRALMDKLDDLFDIFAELFAEFNFDNHKRLVELIRSVKSDMEDSLIPHGNQYVGTRITSYCSRIGRFNEVTEGITFFKFVEALLERAEKDPAGVAEDLREVAQILFNRNNLLMSVVTEASDYPRFEKNIARLMGVFSETPQVPAEWSWDPPPQNEAFLTSSKVQHVGKGANLYDLGYEYSGKFNVLKSLISTHYLWDRVRLMGGAYGSSNSFDYL